MFAFLSKFGRTKSIALQPLEADRAAECARLHASSFAYPWSVPELESMLSAANTVSDGAEIQPGGQMVGFILSRLAADEAEILTIAVDPGWRRQAIAGRLLTTHLEALIRKGIRSLFLEVDEGNEAARALYRRAGFKEVGRREGYYRSERKPPSAALIMRLDL